VPHHVRDRLRDDAQRCHLDGRRQVGQLVGDVEGDLQTGRAGAFHLLPDRAHQPEVVERRRSQAVDNVAWLFTDLTGLLFQAGVMALLHVQMRTRATDVKAISRRLLKLERVLLSIAMVWSVLHAFLPSQRDAAWMHAIDMFWPLSMLGMFFIGIKVARAGRWRGRARAWSFLAETWASATVPAMAILGHGVGDVIGATHLLLGYTVLGLILFTRPDLVRDRG